MTLTSACRVYDRFGITSNYVMLGVYEYLFGWMQKASKTMWKLEGKILSEMVATDFI